MKQLKQLLLTLTLLASTFSYGFTQVEKTNTEKKKTQVLLVGTFHFDNPGRDEFNNEFDDVYSDKRQKEITALNNALGEFAPDKIFLEWEMKEQKNVDSLYAAYLAGNLDIKAQKYGRSEHFQVGFKMGKMLGHDRLYCSDADGLWLGGVVNQAAKEWDMPFIEAYNQRMMAALPKEDSLMRLHTLKEIIYEHNTPESLHDNHNFYVSYSPRVIKYDEEALNDTRGIYHKDEAADVDCVRLELHLVGAELTAEWYRRNIKIYANILSQLEAGDERIMIYYGQAHISIIKQLFEDNPDYEVVDPLEYLK